MGSCVSVHKDHPESGLKLAISKGSENDKLAIPSPIKEKLPYFNGDHRPAADVALKSQSLTTSRDLGSREETFFDSQPWLESDCEDDFFSVNGEFTPSRGSTPVHPSPSVGTPRTNRPLLVEKAPAATQKPSPRKKLSELFKESLRERVTDQNDQSVKTEAKETTIDHGTPRVSEAKFVNTSERTPSGRTKSMKISIKSAHCCLPRLHSDRSFSERKAKMSPVRSIG